ncbi:MAG: DUF4838 domain-containing protein [Clostridia bacterium]|nr:DUF4838 domain-containing protein [Clostridia bacterium]
MNVIMARIGYGRVIEYAFTELEKYLKRIDPKSFIDARVYDTRDLSKENILWVGLDGSVEPSEDDRIKIEVKNGGGIITGSNPRSVLLAVYRFLFELGCRWVRPGEDGEVIPSLSLTRGELNLSLDEAPSQRHRGICIEGQVNYEHVRDLIEWIPRVGMNSYFVQFQTPSYFFKRWYNDQTDCEDIPVDPVDDDDVDHILLRLEEEISRRGLAYHAVGHSWTCEAFGVRGTEWRHHDEPLPEDFANALALRDGKRELWKYSVINTNLCYSNPSVRRHLVDAVLEYCRKHKSVDYLHFWLADGDNNHCECPECVKYRPSDYYIVLLNELDRALTEAGMSTKLVFLIYEDLLWAPEHFHLENPERFTLMFAPITRSYRRAFADFDPKEKLDVKPFIRNKLERPKSVGASVAYLERWQEHFGGDSFDFDYHLMWNHYTDPGYYYTARLLHLDMKNLHKIGLNGMISCQLNRAFLPTALPNYAMAKALWDKESDFEEVCREYYSAAFGEGWRDADLYLRKISELFDLAVATEEKDLCRFISNCKEAKALITSFTESHIIPFSETNPSWRYLEYHAEMCLAYADLAIAGAMHDEAKYEEETERFKALLLRLRPKTHHVFDPRVANRIYESYLHNLLKI